MKSSEDMPILLLTKTYYKTKFLKFSGRLRIG